MKKQKRKSDKIGLLWFAFVTLMILTMISWSSCSPVRTTKEFGKEQNTSFPNQPTYFRGDWICIHNGDKGLIVQHPYRHDGQWAYTVRMEPERMHQRIYQRHIWKVVVR